MLFDVYAASKLGFQWSLTINASGGAVQSFNAIFEMQNVGGQRVVPVPPALFGIRGDVQFRVIQVGLDATGILVVADTLTIDAGEEWPFVVEGRHDGGILFVGATASAGTLRIRLLSSIIDPR